MARKGSAWVSACPCPPSGLRMSRLTRTQVLRPLRASAVISGVAGFSRAEAGSGPRAGRTPSEENLAVLLRSAIQRLREKGAGSSEDPAAATSSTDPARTPNVTRRTHEDIANLLL